MKTALLKTGLLASLLLALFTTGLAHAQPVPPIITNLPPPMTPEQRAAWLAAMTAAQQADYSNNYASWTIPLAGGGPVTGEAMQAQTASSLLALATNLAAMQAAQRAAVSNLLASQTNALPLSWTNSQGNLFYFDHLNEDGSAAIKVTHNLESVQTVGAQRLWPGGGAGFNLNGSGVTLAQWDGGGVMTNHQEFATGGNRVFLLDEEARTNIQDHPTHVAGTMMAYGLYSPAIGYANRARLVEGDFRRDMAGMPLQAATNNVRESNHSYGYSAGWQGQRDFGGKLYYVWYGNPTISSQSWFFGFYDGPASATNDAIIYKAQTYISVFSAGNNSDSSLMPPTQPILHVEYINGLPYSMTDVRPANGTNGFFTLTHGACSKNDLVVGAVSVNTNGYTGTNSVTIANFSSRGPTADGRLKPDVVAPGVDIVSSVAVGTNYYGSMKGTSMAAPAVTGMLGLLTGLYQQLYPANAPLLSGTNAPLASTLRGLLIHTANQLGTNIGPSYTYGWGLINPVAAATLVTNNAVRGSLPFIKEVRLMNGDFIEFPVTLTAGQPFKATITWTDPPGTPVAPALYPTNRMLVNDLDLRVIAPNGTTNLPWVLNRNNPAAAATTGDNVLDNVEQVSLPNPAAGVYRVRVTHKGTLVDDQKQTSYQNVSIITSGNVAQPPVPPYITGISALTVSNTTAIKWSTEVGRVYKVQSRDNLATGAWQDATIEMSATKTNLATLFYTGGKNQQFYRVIQIR